MQDLQLLFEQLVLHPNQPNATESLKAVALALWYDDFEPGLHKFEGIDAAQAGFMLDKLTRYHCLETSRKTKLRTSLLPRLEKQKGCLQGTKATDILAKKWEIEHELKQAFRALLPYQKRHFQHNKHGVETSSNINC